MKLNTNIILYILTLLAKIADSNLSWNNYKYGDLVCLVGKYLFLWPGSSVFGHGVSVI